MNFIYQLIINYWVLHDPSGALCDLLWTFQTFKHDLGFCHLWSMTDFFRPTKKWDLRSTLNVVTSFFIIVASKLQSGQSQFFSRGCAVFQEKRTIAYFRFQNFGVLFIVLLLSCSGNGYRKWCGPFQFVTSGSIVFDSLSFSWSLQVTTVCR